VIRTGAALVVIAAAFLLGGCGGDDDAGTSRKSDPFETVSKQPSLTRTARRAAARWETVARFGGEGPATHAVTIAPGAIQARALWRCTRGSFVVAVEPAPRSPLERPRGSCPGRGETTWVKGGAQRLRVTASGSWSVVVQHQIDTPIAEPILASMRAPGARVLKSGSFFAVERTGAGRARLYRLADGRGALRLDPFRVSTNTDLFVWFSTARNPRTTAAAVKAKRLHDVLLKATIGSQNYVLPKSVDPRRVRSIVIWCQPVSIVYSAAVLRG
jgi:hypothetical protein